MPSRCLSNNCPKKPYYSYDGVRAQFCGTHRTDQMISCFSKESVKKRRKTGKTCFHEDCASKPLYSDGTGRRPIWCGEHKQEGAVLVVFTCEEEGCKKPPTHGIHGTEIPLRCCHHKKPHMVDVVSKTCFVSDCYVRPTYAFEGNPCTACARHKIEGMIDRKSSRCKFEGGCSKQPLYGFERGRPKLCGIHKLEGMINVKNASKKKEGERGAKRKKNDEIDDDYVEEQASKKVKRTRAEREKEREEEREREAAAQEFQKPFLADQFAGFHHQSLDDLCAAVAPLAGTTLPLISPSLFALSLETEKEREKLISADFMDTTLLKNEREEERESTGSEEERERERERLNTPFLMENEVYGSAIGHSFVPYFSYGYFE